MNYTTDYLDEPFKGEFLEYASRDHFDQHPLTAKSYRNAIVLPFKKLVGGGGVIKDTYEYIVESALDAENLMNKGYEVSDVQDIDERAIYLGCFICQWGHFLLDFVPRLWYLIDNDDSSRKLVYVSMNGQPLVGNFLEFMKVFGVNPNRLQCITVPSRFTDIIVPETSYARPFSYTREYARIFEFIRSKVEALTTTYPTYEKIYWTRTKLPKARHSEIGEKDLERMFKANGYKVLAPEKLTLVQQIHHFSTCKHMAGVSGTIPHNLVFSNKETEFIILNRTYRINVNQFPINQMSGAKVVYIDSHASFLPVSADKGPYWMVINANIKKFAEDFSFRIPSLLMKGSGRISRRKWAKYCTMYFNTYSGNELSKTDAGMAGSIMGRSRPSAENTPQHELYYYYRQQFTSICTLRTRILAWAHTMKQWLKHLLEPRKAQAI